MLGFSCVPSLRVLAFIFVAGGVLFSTTPVQGQELSSSQSPSEGPTHSSQLPDWAEPSSGTSGAEGSNTARINDQVRTKQPSLPDDPQQVPVDGGLALLAAAGAGYAVRRLNNEEKDEHED